MLKQAGIAPASLSSLTWDPQDGGSYERMLAKLSVDRSGHDATQAGFNPNGVRQYRLVIDNTTLDAYGQTTWSGFAVSTGFHYDNRFWGMKCFYNDPRLAETLRWMACLGRGIAVPQDQTGRGAALNIFAAGRAATMITGSWLAH